MRELLDLKADLERRLKIVNDALGLLDQLDLPAKKIQSQKTKAQNLVSSSNGKVSNEDIRKVIAGTDGNFTVAAIVESVQKEFPSKELRRTAIPSVLFLMKK